MGYVSLKHERVVPGQIIKTVAAAATPEAITDTPVYFSYAHFIGNKAARTGNTGTVYLGVTSGNDTQPIAIATGATFTLSAPGGIKLDFHDFYIDVVTNGDGLVIIYA